MKAIISFFDYLFSTIGSAFSFGQDIMPYIREGFQNLGNVLEGLPVEFYGVIGFVFSFMISIIVFNIVRDLL